MANRASGAAYFEDDIASGGTTNPTPTSGGAVTARTVSTSASETPSSGVNTLADAKPPSIDITAHRNSSDGAAADLAGAVALSVLVIFVFCILTSPPVLPYGTSNQYSCSTERPSIGGDTASQRMMYGAWQLVN